MTAENFMRSTKAPTISAGVMIAKVIWNMKNTVSGIVAGQRVGADAGQESLAEAANKCFALPPSPKAML